MEITRQDDFSEVTGLHGSLPPEVKSVALPLCNSCAPSSAFRARTAQVPVLLGIRRYCPLPPQSGAAASESLMRRFRKTTDVAEAAAVRGFRMASHDGSL